jgi:MFS family permease
MKQVIVNMDKKTIISETFAQTSGKKNLAVAFIICYISIMFSGISSMLMSVYLPVAVKDLLGNVSAEKMNTISAYINSIFILGSMFGGFAWGFICDKIGRSKTVIFSTALYGLFTVLTSFSSSWLLVGVYRFITGFGVGGVILTTNILIAEIWPEKNKAVAIGLVSAAMPVGFIVAGMLNNLITDWHDAFSSGLVPLITASIGVFILQDSTSWKKNKEAVVNEINKNLFEKRHAKNLISGSIIFGAMLIGLWATFSWSPTWAQSITADAAKANELRGTVTMVLAFAGLGGSIISGWIVNLLGMRKTMMLCFVMCFIMTFVVFKLNNSVSTAALIEMAVLAVFFGISQGALSVFIPYLFPTKIRASATGFCFNIGRIFTATVVFFIGALVTMLGGYGNAIFIFSFIFLIGFAAIFFSKEKDINDKTIQTTIN